jgi:hypothetical protein
MDKITKQQLMEMKLHERLSISESSATKQWIMRVIGGWIYYRQHFIKESRQEPLQLIENSTFVPEPIENELREINMKLKFQLDTKQYLVKLKNLTRGENDEIQKKITTSPNGG